MGADAADDSPRTSTRTVQVEFEGLVRTVLVTEPVQVPATPVPLLVDLHGSGFDAMTHMRTTRLERYCHAVIVRPQAAIPLHFRPDLASGWAWNVPGVPLYGSAAGSAPQPDDTAFLAGVLHGTHRLWTVPVSGRHLVGFSGGARMASHLASDLSAGGRLSLDSLAVVGGLRPPDQGAAGSVPVLAIHGRNDAVNPFDGGLDARWDSPVLENARCWAGTGQAGTTDLGDGPGVRVHRFGRVTLVEHRHGGHCWPGTPDEAHRAVFDVSEDLDASAVIADFLGCGSPR